MASVCFYFQMHQPRRLRRYSVFDSDHNYFDNERNRQILLKVAQKCYLPATHLIRDLIHKHEGRFRVAFSLTGCIIEQFRDDCAQMIDLLQELAATGCVEFLSETYYHSLGFLYSRDEFLAQVDLHTCLMQDLFGQRPAVFRNTELIYSNDLAVWAGSSGRYLAVLAEGADHILQGRSPNYVYTPPGTTDSPKVKLLLKNYRLSDDIAFRFSNREWDGWPLTADKFAQWIGAADGRASSGDLYNLFLDYETFGEHQWADTGIFAFLEALPDEILKAGHIFQTPSESIHSFEPVAEFNSPHTISWADTERDLSAWLGNAMQANALHELYKLERPIRQSGDEELLADWRNLTISDHFYYMCTKYFADGTVHKYFNPYESPYDSYINFMNVLDSLCTRVEQRNSRD